MRNLMFMLAVTWGSVSSGIHATELGAPPRAPVPFTAEVRRVTPQAVESLSVNISSRNAVRNFYNSQYMASATVPIGWSGDVATCNEGGTTVAFRDAVALRINYYRAMAGLPAGIAMGSDNNVMCQKAALMMSRNGDLSHAPPTAWACYTVAGAQGAGNGNLALGAMGPVAVDLYMEDPGAGNYPVGHRRWLLYPQTQTMGTGDIPTSAGFWAANALWVFDENVWGPRPATRSPFVAWPPAGFVPYQVVWPRWSLSHPAADFSAATVQMSSGGVNIPLNVQQPLNGYGENTLVWNPTSLEAATSFQYEWPRPAVDTSYIVTVSNIVIAGVTQEYRYTVRVMDPAVAGVSTSVRMITGTNVAVAVTPDVDVSAYAVEENIPAGVTPVNYNNNGGAWDSGNRKLRWGPFFDAIPRSLTYSGAGSGTLTGTASFDEVGQDTTGASAFGPTTTTSSSTTSSSTTTTTSSSTTSSSTTLTATTTSSSTTAISPLALALDDPALTWSSGGAAPWLSQATVTRDGVDAAANGAIGHGQQSWVETRVTGPGVMTFSWKVSAGPGDGAQLLVDGTQTWQTAGGELDWVTGAYSVGPGSHTYRWLYLKDGSGSGGQDRMWLDQVQWANADHYRSTTAWDQGSVYWNNGWSHLNWFGFYSDTDLQSGGWIWHEHHDYLYIDPGSTPSSVWFLMNPAGWIWTSSTHYPYLFGSSYGLWFWYSPGSDTPRLFYNTRNGRWYSL